MSFCVEPTEDQQALLRSLRQAERRTVKHMFCSLPAPFMVHMFGEYDAELLDQGGRLTTLLTRIAFGSQGAWIGKAFRPNSATTGEGYNSFKGHGKSVSKLFMDTYIGDSAIDDKQSFILDYSVKNRGLIRWLVGEVRQLSPSVFIGMGTFGPRQKRTRKLLRVIPFVLVGPMRSYNVEGHAAASNALAARKAAA